MRYQEFAKLSWSNRDTAMNTSTGATAVSPETPLDNKPPAAADRAAGRTPDQTTEAP
jgi:hypothetical protein